MGTANLNQLIEEAKNQLERQQYSEAWIKKHNGIYQALSMFCQSNAVAEYSSGVGTEFLQTIANINPVLSHDYFRTYVLAIERLNSISEEKDNWHPHFGRLKDYAYSCFDEVVKSYEVYLYSAGKKKYNVRCRVHVVARFLCFVGAQGVSTLAELTLHHINDAFQTTTDSKDAFHKSVSAFLSYAYHNAWIKKDYSKFVPTIRKYCPLPTVYSPEEVEAILSSVDRNTIAGKRNYAITLIAARLGLRRSDIANLTFGNVNFAQNTIKLFQVKTGQLLQLPLLPEVKSALLDYIGNARPQYDGEQIFLSTKRFNIGPLLSHNIYNIISRTVAKAPIERKNRHCGPRAFRSSLATALFDEGNNHTTVGRVLGHKDPNAVQSYVKVGLQHLRGCALRVPKPSLEFEQFLTKAEVSV